MLHFESTSSDDFFSKIEWENNPENKNFIFQYLVAKPQEVINNKDQLHLKLIDNQGVMVYFIISKGLQNLNLSVELKRIVINKKGKNYGKI